MKKLYLLRHAEAERGAGKSDFERPLTPFGRSQAKLVGEYLKDNSIMPDLILCSDAVRTGQTLDLINEVYQLTSKIVLVHDLYNASTDVLEKHVLMTNEATGSLMLVGHNPAITMLPLRFALYEVTKSLGDFQPTGKFVGLCFDKGHWSSLLTAPGRVINLFCP